MGKDLVISDDDVLVDEEVNDDEIFTAEHDRELEEAAKQSVKSVTIDDALNPEEKKQIEQNKKKRITKKQQEEVVTETFDISNDNELTEDELAISLSLQEELNGFIKDKVKLVPGEGVKNLLPTGIDVLDTVAGGGFAAGALTTIVGNPGTFKSAILAQTIGSCQRRYRGKVGCAYLDSEEAMSTQRLANLGARYPRLKPYNNVTIEDLFRMIETFCAFKEKTGSVALPSIIGWDSVANTICEKEKEANDLDINKMIGLRSRIISMLLPRYIPKLQEYNIGLVAINQLREKINIGNMPTASDLRWLGDKTIPGGNSLKFNAFHLLFLKVKGDLKEEQWGFSGVHLEAKFVKNKLFRPNIVVDLIVDFNTGVSNFWTNYYMLGKFGRMTTGAWNYLRDLPSAKFRTKDAVIKYNEEQEFRIAYDEAVKDTLKTEYLDKYGSVEI
jgi:RecA/RadA recombinase